MPKLFKGFYISEDGDIVMSYFDDKPQGYNDGVYLSIREAIKGETKKCLKEINDAKKRLDQMAKKLAQINKLQ